MPTAAKLAAAIAFSVVALLAAHFYIPALPEGAQIGYFREITAALGFVVGWVVMGGLVGHSYADAVGSGIRTSATVLFWALLGFSIREMVLRSMKMLYDGPMEAVVGIFDLMLKYGALMGRADFIAVLVLGGAMGGVFAEWVGRRWK